jgi:hypothetical protein
MVLLSGAREWDQSEHPYIGDQRTAISRGRHSDVILFSSKFAAIDKRFDDMRDMWRAELRRVAEVLDARLKHIEERG